MMLRALLGYGFASSKTQRAGDLARARQRHALTPLHVETLEDRRLLAGTPELLLDIKANGSSNPAGFVEVGGQIFFSATDATHGTELWKSDGTAAGTVLVKDIRSLAGSSNPTNLTKVGGTLYFTANDGGGNELWKSDGTTNGTVRVADISSNPVGSTPGHLTNANGTLYFTADDGLHGIELWRSNGTELGTVLVKDIDPVASSDPSYLTVAGGSLFFSASDGTRGRELWATNLATSETLLVKELNAGAYGSYPGYFNSMTEVSGTLFFAAMDSQHGFELWKSNGTATGTSLVADINPTGSSFPFVMTNVNGNLYFTADDGTTGFELWRSGGTPETTWLVKDINTNVKTGSGPDELTNVNGTLYFRANDGTTGVELWRSNGTAGGTQRVQDINSSGSSTPHGLTNVNGTLYFSATEGLTGTELWRVLGPNSSAALFGDVALGTASSNPMQLANGNGTLYFSAQSSSGNIEPWVVRDSPANVVGRYLFYNQSKFDGNSAGASAADDAAIAPDKTALLPGAGTATFASISSYTRGINGVMIDVVGSHGTLTPADFTFRVGANNSLSSWTTAPAPVSITTRVGAGVGGSDRVTLIWDANAIDNEWLEVGLLANTNTRLPTTDTFYFGSRIADTGSGTPTLATTNFVDENDARANIGSGATTANVYDFDRTGLVTTTDSLAARMNAGYLIKISVPLPPAGAPQAAPLVQDASLQRVASALACLGTDEGAFVAETAATDDVGDLKRPANSRIGSIAAIRADLAFDELFGQSRLDALRLGTLRGKFHAASDKTFDEFGRMVDDLEIGAILKRLRGTS